MRIRSGFIAAAVCASAIYPICAEAADARLTYTIKITGSEAWQDGEAWGQTSTNETVYMSTDFIADEELMETNPKSPTYAADMQAQAAGVMRAVQAQSGIATAPPVSPEALSCCCRSRLQWQYRLSSGGRSEGSAGNSGLAVWRCGTCGRHGDRAGTTLPAILWSGWL